MKKHFLILLFLIILPFSTHAQWNPDGGLVLLTHFSHFEDWFVVPDDEGGFWLAYMLDRPGQRCFIQRYDSLGYVQYEGRGISMVDREIYEDVLIITGVVSDGEGGIIISFRNGNHDGDHPYGMYVQRINSDGEYVFGDEALLTVPGRYVESLIDPKACSDQAGGIFQAYWAYPNQHLEFGVQYVTNSGNIMFGADCVCVPEIEFSSIYPTSDGSGAFVVGFEAGEEDQISCAKINLEGDIEWRTEINNPEGHIRQSNDISVAHTPQRDIWVAWGTNQQPHIAKLDSSGEITIPAFNMFPDYNQDDPKFTKVVCDDEGAAYLAVVDSDDSDDQRINKVAPDGSLPWGGDGIEISTFEPSDILGLPSEFLWDQATQRIIISFRAGVYLQDEERWVTAQYIQAINPEGERLWNDEGVFVMSMDMLDARGETILLGDGSYLVLNSGYINEVRHLKAGKVYPDGTIAQPSSVPDPNPSQPVNQWKIISAYPNPFNSSVTIDLQVGLGSSKLRIYDITGRLVYSKQLAENHSRLTWHPGSELASGIYFIELKTAMATDTRKIVMLE